MDAIKRWAATLLVGLLLSGCGAAGGSLASEEPQTSSPPVSTTQDAPEKEAPSLTPELEEQLLELASIHDLYRSGSSFSQEEAVYADNSMAFGYLREHGLLGAYEQDGSNSWTIPYPVLEEVNRLFFAKLEQAHGMDTASSSHFSFDWYIAPYFLEQQEAARLDDGSISVTYRRALGDAVLTPVTFVFLPYEIEEVPGILSALHQPGDTLYKILSVAHRFDLLPETQPQTIEIATAEELLAAAERINEGKFEHRFDTYLLTADIDLAGVEWTPIGLNNRVLEYWHEYDTGRDPNLQGFNGTFDGQGHTIRNFTIPEEESKKWLGKPEQGFPERSVGGLGFFYRIGTQGVVKNLNLKDASVALPMEENPYGASAGLLAASCRGRIENVSVQGAVQAVSSVGGLAGELVGWDAVGLAENCTADVQVTGHSGVGGMVGLLHAGSLVGCTSSGSVTAASTEDIGYAPGNIGGMVGLSVDGNAVRCHASAFVLTEVLSRCVGGFGGLWEGGSILSCSVDGQKTGNWEAIDDYHRMEPEIETT